MYPINELAAGPDLTSPTTPNFDVEVTKETVSSAAELALSTAKTTLNSKFGVPQIVESTNQSGSCEATLPPTPLNRYPEPPKKFEGEGQYSNKLKMAISSGDLAHSIEQGDMKSIEKKLNYAVSLRENDDSLLYFFKLVSQRLPEHLHIALREQGGTSITLEVKDTRKGTKFEVTVPDPPLLRANGSGEVTAAESLEVAPVELNDSLSFKVHDLLSMGPEAIRKYLNNKTPQPSDR